MARAISPVSSTNSFHSIQGPGRGEQDCQRPKRRSTKNYHLIEDMHQIRGDYLDDSQTSSSFTSSTTNSYVQLAQSESSLTDCDGPDYKEIAASARSNKNVLDLESDLRYIQKMQEEHLDSINSLRSASDRTSSVDSKELESSEEFSEIKTSDDLVNEEFRGNMKTKQSVGEKRPDNCDVIEHPNAQDILMHRSMAPGALDGYKIALPRLGTKTTETPSDFFIDCDIGFRRNDGSIVV